MAEKKWPYDGYPGLSEEDRREIESKPAAEQGMDVFMLEGARAQRIDGYRTRIRYYLAIANAFKEDPRQSVKLLDQLLNEFPIFRYVITTEMVIEQALEVLEEALKKMANTFPRSADDDFEVDDSHLEKASLTAGTVHNKLAIIIANAGFKPAPVDESMLRLESISQRERALAARKTVPEAVLKREGPALSEKIQKNITQYAAAIALLTIYDLFGTKEAMGDFRLDFERQRLRLSGLQPMIDLLKAEGLDEQMMRSILEKGLRTEKREFSESCGKMEARLMLSKGRMMEVNEKGNTEIARLFTRERLVKLLAIIDQQVVGTRGDDGFIMRLKGRLISSPPKYTMSSRVERSLKGASQRAIKKRTTEDEDF